MTTLNKVMGAFARHLGFPVSRTRTVARRLQESQIIPSGAPGRAPVLDIDHALGLLVAVAIDRPLHEVANALQVYRDMTPAGADLSHAPSSIPRSAELALSGLADAALDPESMKCVEIEFVSNWPEMAIRWADGLTQRFRPLGDNAAHWGADNHRRAITINGAAFQSMLRDIRA